MEEVKQSTERRLNLISLISEEDVIPTRLRIERTWYTRKYVINKIEPEPCMTCGTNTLYQSAENLKKKKLDSTFL